MSITHRRTPTEKYDTNDDAWWLRLRCRRHRERMWGEVGEDVWTEGFGVWQLARLGL